jgi:hypothetical protein
VEPNRLLDVHAPPSLIPSRQSTPLEIPRHNLHLVLLQLGEVRVGQLIRESSCHARMLQHVVERQIPNQIVDGVNVVVRILKR